MRISHDNCRNGRIDGKRRGSSILRAQGKRCQREKLECLVRKVAGCSSERTIAKVVEYSKASAEERAPILSITELVGQAQSSERRFRT